MNRRSGFQKYLNLVIFFIICLLFLSSFSGLVIASGQSDFGNIDNLDICHKIFNHQKTRATRKNISLPVLTDNTIVYAIICPTNFSESLEPLAAWKTRKGVPAKIYTIDGKNGIYQNFTNGDNASRIHDFLYSLHENNSKLQWLLIVGDEDIIPSRQVFVNASELYGLDDYYYSDHYYAGLNNSWDQDGDGIYGEQRGDVNWQADLYVGRLPVNNIADTEFLVNRIIEYESKPRIGPWMQNASLWSGLLDGPNNLSAYQDYKDNAKKVTDKIIPLIPKHMNVSVLYDYPQLNPGNYSFETDILDHRKARNNFYAGNSIVSFAGQAYYTGDELAHYLDITGMSAAPDGFGSLFSYNDAKFAENGEKLPLVYLSTCSVDFSETDDSNLEQLLISETGGAIGLIGNSGKSYRGETSNDSSYGNWWLNENYWKLFFNGTQQPGKCLYELKEKYVWEVIRPGVPYIQMAVANLVGYNLLGDPELNVWTNKPRMIDYNYSLIKDNGYKLKIEVISTSNEPLDNALVCVYNSNFYQYETTDEGGIVILDIDPRKTGELKVTISSPNHLPFFSNLTYKNKAPVFGIINDIIMDEDEILEDYVNLKLYTMDEDTEFDDLEFTILNITDPHLTVRIDNSKHIDILPYLNWYGEAVVTLQVSDGVDFNEVSFNITVNNVNDPPEINEVIENQELMVGDSFEYTISASDIDNDKLKFSDNTKLFDINEDTGEISYKAKEADVGAHEISIFVSDGNSSATMTFKIEIDSKASFLELWGVPLAIILGTIIIIIAIKLYAITHPEQIKKSDEQKIETDSAKKENIKKKKTSKK